MICPHISPLLECHAKECALHRTQDKDLTYPQLVEVTVEDVRGRTPQAARVYVQDGAARVDANEDRIELVVRDPHECHRQSFWNQHMRVG